MVVALDVYPLGVRRDVPLTAAQRAALQHLQDFDLAPVRERLLHDGVLPAAWVDEAIHEFRRFIGLHVVDTAPASMLSAAVDEVWHACLLHTRLYAALCDQTVGQFIHHEPEPPPGTSVPGDVGDLAERGAFQTFKERYVSIYGETGRLWRFPALWWQPATSRPQGG